MHDLSMMTFSFPPPPRAAPVAHKFVWPQRAPKINPSRSEPSSQLTNFLQNHRNPPRALPVHDVIHIPKSHFSFWDFYFDIYERHILPARALTPALKFAPN